jgi:hypothetical protein
MQMQTIATIRSLLLSQAFGAHGLYVPAEIGEIITDLAARDFERVRAYMACECKIQLQLRHMINYCQASDAVGMHIGYARVELGDRSIPALMAVHRYLSNRTEEAELIEELRDATIHEPPNDDEVINTSWVTTYIRDLYQFKTKLAATTFMRCEGMYKLAKDGPTWNRGANFSAMTGEELGKHHELGFRSKTRADHVYELGQFGTGVIRDILAEIRRDIVDPWRGGFRRGQ